MTFFPQVLQTNRALISLSLRDCQLTTACLPALAFVLTRHPSLADLQLKGSALSGWGIHSLSQALAAQTPVSLKTTGLRTLELQATGLASNDIHLLARAIAHNTTLTGLNLNDNKLGDSGVELLVSVSLVFPKNDASLHRGCFLAGFFLLKTRRWSRIHAFLRLAFAITRLG